MRIIGGRLKRRHIESPPGRTARPTTDRTREAAFNLVESRIEIQDANVLDLFAGSGALGLEALSRGAASATFVESDGRVMNVARTNAQTLDLDEHCTFLRYDALAYLRREPEVHYDIIFADPPYDLPSTALLPDLALPHLVDGGLFVLEHDAKISVDHHPNVDTSRRYGKTMITIFRRNDAAPDSPSES